MTHAPKGAKGAHLGLVSATATGPQAPDGPAPTPAEGAPRPRFPLLQAFSARARLEEQGRIASRKLPEVEAYVLDFGVMLSPTVGKRVTCEIPRGCGAVELAELFEAIGARFRAFVAEVEEIGTNDGHSIPAEGPTASPAAHAVGLALASVSPSGGSAGAGLIHPAGCTCDRCKA